MYLGVCRECLRVVRGGVCGHYVTRGQLEVMVTMSMCFVESVVFSHIVFLQNLLHISYRIDHILSGSGNNVNLFSSCVSSEILRQEVDSRIGLTL